MGRDQEAEFMGHRLPCTAVTQIRLSGQDALDFTASVCCSQAQTPFRPGGLVPNGQEGLPRGASWLDRRGLQRA